MSRIILQGSIFFLCCLLLLACMVEPDEKPKLGGGSLQNATIFNQPGVFYRIEADYKYLETGEILKFDYVTSCFNRDTPGSYSPSLLPDSYFLPTSNGAAVQVITFNLCSYGGKWPDAPKTAGVPHPLTIVYDDVNDLRFGWGYINHHAYDNPNAKIKFLREGGYVCGSTNLCRLV